MSLAGFVTLKGMSVPSPVMITFCPLIFAYLAIFQWRDLLTTRLENIMAIAVSLFWFLRGINQVVFYGLTAALIRILSNPVEFEINGINFGFIAIEHFDLPIGEGANILQVSEVFVFCYPDERKVSIDAMF